jgi:hypothetical protein
MPIQIEALIFGVCTGSPSFFRMQGQYIGTTSSFGSIFSERRASRGAASVITMMTGT